MLDINASGVSGLRTGDDFMPAICLSCDALSYDYSEWHGRSFFACERNVWMPVRSGRCGKRTPPVAADKALAGAPDAR